MLTYNKLAQLEKLLESVPDYEFFTAQNGAYLYAYNIEAPVSVNIHILYREFFETFDPALVKEMVRYIKMLKKRHTYKRRNTHG